MGAKALRERIGARAARFRPSYLLGVGLAALVPLIVFAGLWLRSEFDKSRRDIESVLSAHAGALVQWIDAEVRQEAVTLQAVAALPSLDEASPSEFHAAATRMATAVPQWAFLALANPSGDQLLNTQRPLGSALPDLGAAATIRRAAETRQLAVQTLDDATGQAGAGRVVLLCIPVIRDDAARFVLVAGMKTEVLQQLVGRTAEPGIQTLVLGERDQVLAHSRDWVRLFGDPGSARGPRPGPGQPLALFTGSAPDGRAVTTAAQRSPLVGWTVLAASDRSPIEQMSARSTWATLWAGALSLLLAGVLAVFLFYNIAERRLSDERLAASRALSELDARLLSATQDALTEQRKAASERDVLLREIYHRVKNNLQIVQSLLRLGSRDLRSDQREPFESAIRRIGAMARVHTLLYNSPDLASIDFKDYLEGLLREAAEAFGAEERGIQTVLNAESMRVPLDTAVPLAFVTIEIITNALKHAFPEGRPGAVTVTAAQEDGHGVLTVSDNGVGLPAEAGAKRSLGLTIVGKLVDQIGGSVEKPAVGESTYRIRFPIHAVAGSEAGPRPNP